MWPPDITLASLVQSGRNISHRGQGSHYRGYQPDTLPLLRGDKQEIRTMSGVEWEPQLYRGRCWVPWSVSLIVKGNSIGETLNLGTFPFLILCGGAVSPRVSCSIGSFVC